MMTNEKCIEPKVMGEGDLLAYNAGEATAEIAAHIENCPFCQAEAAMLARLEGEMLPALYRYECPQTDTLLDYVSDFLAVAEVVPLEAHLATCLLCRDEVAHLRDIGGEEVVSVPAGWLEKVMLAGQEWLAGVFQPVVSGVAVRGGARQQYQYEAGGYELVVTLAEMQLGTGQWRLQGQITALAEPTATFVGQVVVRGGELERPLALPLDEFGYFEMEALPTGEYGLQVQLVEVVMTIEQLRVA
ncbi:MAG TPA: hypothetical protein VLL52_16355 [Anaerolineae bacterium]|nr:hypothetical protein [Anaerolineae bacterium]